MSGDLWWGFNCLQLWELVKQAPRGCCLCVWCWSLRSVCKAVRLGELKMMYTELERKGVTLLANFACGNRHREFHVWGASWGFHRRPQKAPGPKFFLEVEFDGKKNLDLSFSKLFSISNHYKGPN